MRLRHGRFVAVVALLIAAAGGGGCGASASGEDPAPAADDRPRRAAGARSAGFLIVDGVYNTELTAPWDVFEHTLHHAPEGEGIEVFTVSPDGAAVTTAEGLEIGADYGFADAPVFDILVVPSAAGSRDRDRADEAMIDWVRRAGARAGYVVSLCWGAFVLAEAGLLDEVACTTFPGDYDTFARRFPRHDLRVNVSFVHDGKAITSQGGVRSFDAALYLVDLLYGREVARAVGRGLLISWPQPGLLHVSDTAAAR